jgi:hypothetical protein
VPQSRSLWSPSPETRAHQRRFRLVFLFSWLLFIVYSVGCDLGYFPDSWARFVVPIAVLTTVVSFFLVVPFLLSARRDIARSQHPEPNVCALIDGEITLEQYGQRKQNDERKSEG